MFFRKKKPAPEPEPAASRPVESASSANQSTLFLTGNDRVDRRSVDVLLTAIARVSQSRDLESLLVYIVDTSIEVTGAERGLLILHDEAGEMQIRVARQRGGQGVTGQIRFSTSVVKRVLEKEEPVRATVTSDSEALELGTSVFDLKLRAVMCVPLVTTGKDGAAARVERGALYVDSKAATREFKHEDLALFAALSQHVSIALENARLHIVSVEKAKLDQSLEIASQIQHGLMPQVPEGVAGYDVHGWYRPAERTTGDFYDFIRTKRGALAVVVGDVTGHGIGPALITATAQASLRSYLRVLDDPAAVFTMLNQDLAPRMDDGLFLTLFLGLFDPHGKLHVINAGQTPPLIWRAESKKIERIAGTAPALGMVDDFEYTEGPSLTLSPEDTLVAFTDGFVEARSASDPDHLFEEAGMSKILENRASAGCTAKELTEALVKGALEFAGGKREDDMTVVAVRRAART
jgi:serine phosphatase RsbU (regulator of sigma subunit)